MWGEKERLSSIYIQLHMTTVSDETGDITYFKEHELTPLKGGLTYV
ncbi:SPBc2 prophage-derived uncharacterized protein YorP [Bacillus subtilis]|nr:SPBc2 prophage-derived uncharacterized protein YorP [Bacillus subtilis]